MNFCTYILESESSGRLYIGSTNDLEDRFIRHNAGRNKYTKGKGPWKIIFTTHFNTRAKAVQLEFELKKIKNPKRIHQWIKTQSD